jgi:2,3-dihydroxyphenylpropionate 1,2-dioxygenase
VSFDFALVAASHTPLMMDEALAGPGVTQAVQASFAQAAAFVRDFGPERIVQFSPDHFHGFHYGLMPSFCVATAAHSYGDYGTATGSLAVDEAFALGLLNAVREADIDAAVSFDMTVDHGFVQMWEVMFGRFDDLPITPVFLNAIAYPIPRYRRARLLGQAVGRFAAASGQRVMFAASGGLSHDPVVPRISGSTSQQRDRLIGRAPMTADQQAAREKAVYAAGLAARDGGGPSRPLNPRFDRDFLDMLANRDWTAIDSLTPEGVEAVAGSAANEILAWVAASAALEAAAGPYKIVQRDYRPIPGWIAGLAVMTAVPTHGKGDAPHER